MQSNLRASRPGLSPWLLRIPLAAGVLIILVLGVWAGLLRIGWSLPSPQAGLALIHGPLLVCGLLGTVIGLERGVALGRVWAFVGPVLTLVGAVALLLGLPAGPAAGLMAGGSIGLIAVFVALIRRQPARFTLTMAAGAVAWLIGNLLWLAGKPFALVAFWWAGFLVLTVVGERLELGRLRQLPPRALWAFTAGVVVLLAGLLLAVVAFDAGIRLVGLAFLWLGLWLLQYDLARRTIRKAGVPRFSATCILSGSLWLAVGGVLALITGAVYSGPLYDALLHTVFVGFIFAMVFGHAPIVVPALLKLPLPFSRWSYLPLLLLHLSLLLRLVGDLATLIDVRRWGGMLNAVALLLFLLMTVTGVVRAARRQATTQVKPLARRASATE